MHGNRVVASFKDSLNVFNADVKGFSFSVESIVKGEISEHRFSPVYDVSEAIFLHLFGLAEGNPALKIYTSYNGVSFFYNHDLTDAINETEVNDFPTWADATAYHVGDYVEHEDEDTNTNLYRCLQSHVSDDDEFEPDDEEAEDYWEEVIEDVDEGGDYPFFVDLNVKPYFKYVKIQYGASTHVELYLEKFEK